MMNKRTKIAIIVLLVLFISACSPQSRYEKAVRLMEDGEYTKAAKQFAKIEDFEDSGLLAQRCEEEVVYLKAKELFDSEDYSGAQELLLSIPSHDAASIMLVDATNEVTYAIAISLVGEERYEEAMDVLVGILGFSDASSMYAHCTEEARIRREYKAALDSMASKDYKGAYSILATLGGYEDSTTLMSECREKSYIQAGLCLENGEKAQAYDLLSWLGGYRDSSEKLKECIIPMPSSGVILKPVSGSINVTLNCTDPDNGFYFKVYKSDGTLAHVLFVRPNSKATAKLPSGTYSINVARGAYWFGEEEMFGSKGVYQQLLFNNGNDSTFSIRSNYDYTIKLGVTDGNVGTKAINPGSF
ncbi:MAG: hypothetical protein FWG10_07615 [Eubacteriaceae bacterium]|nr:hypothetical protein [Eubacteriaceae bacterium]